MSDSAVHGWFTTGADAHLVGTRCQACGSYRFPPETAFCPNPACDGSALKEIALGKRGRVWSWTTNHYAPPPPGLATDPFEPYTVLAVELPAERMVVLGQLAAGEDPARLSIGTEVDLVVEPIVPGSEETWKWRIA